MNDKDFLTAILHAIRARFDNPDVSLPPPTTETTLNVRADVYIHFEDDPEEDTPGGTDDERQGRAGDG